MNKRRSVSMDFIKLSLNLLKRDLDSPMQSNEVSSSEDSMSSAELCSSARLMVPKSKASYTKLRGLPKKNSRKMSTFFKTSLPGGL